MNAKLYALVILATVFVLAASACQAQAPSSDAIATAIAQTQSAPTPTVDVVAANHALATANAQLRDQLATAQAPVLQPTLTSAVTSAPTSEVTIVSTQFVETPESAATEAPAQMAETYSYDLFDRSDGLCFTVEWSPVRGYHRVLEFLYGLRIDKAANKLVEYAPSERGNDPNTWPGRIVLVNASSNRDTECGEVEARRPILFRMAPKAEDLAVQWVLTMDNVDNADFNTAYKTASVGKPGVGIFIGSEKGVDVKIRTFDESGNVTDQQFHRIAGAYCNDCYVGTSLTSSKAQFASSPESFSFDPGDRKILTTDVLALYFPPEFKGRYEITMSVKAGSVAEWFLGALDSKNSSAVPTATATATP